MKETDALVPAYSLKDLGEPRVGNKNFAAYVKSTKIPHTRTVHASDSKSYRIDIPLGTYMAPSAHL